MYFPINYLKFKTLLEDKFYLFLQYFYIDEHDY